MAKNIKKRGTNFTVQDKLTLLDVVREYKDVIENKKTDGANQEQKDDAWDKVGVEYNSLSTTVRSVQQLKDCYSNIKKRTKKDVADEKCERNKTGGGSYVPKVDLVGEKLISLLGPQFLLSIENEFDSDFQYNYTVNRVSGNEISQEEINTHEEQPGTTEESQQLFSGESFRVIATFEDPRENSSAIIQIPSASGSIITGIQNPSTSSSSKSVDNGRLNSSTAIRTKRSRRQPRLSLSPYRKNAQDETRSRAADGISDAAQAKARYYKRLLEMAEERHTAEMKSWKVKE